MAFENVGYYFDTQDNMEAPWDLLQQIMIIKLSKLFLTMDILDSFPYMCKVIYR